VKSVCQRKRLIYSAQSTPKIHSKKINLSRLPWKIVAILNCKLDWIEQIIVGISYVSINNYY